MKYHPVDSVFAALAGDYLRHLLNGERRLATQCILDAVESGTTVREVYLHVFQPTQYEIGRMWQNNEITVADEHYCTAATQLVMSLLYSRLFDTIPEPRNTEPIVVSAVAGELHELGARMVADILELEAWKTIYLGANTPVDALVQTVAERRARVVSISVTLPAHLDNVADLITRLRANDVTVNAKVLVGGLAFGGGPELWKDVGADATAPDALRAAGAVESLLTGERG